MFIRQAIILICLAPTIALSQPGPAYSQIQNQDQLIDALLGSDDRSSVATLLSKHKNLIAVPLWERLVAMAGYSHDHAAASLLFEAALQVSTELDDNGLIGTTYYKLGKYQFRRGNISAAIKSYLHAKQVFEEKDLKRDLIYILADLGTLYIHSSDYGKAKEYSEQSIAFANQLRTGKTLAGTWPEEYAVGIALSNLGNVSRWNGEYHRAVEYFQKSLALFEKLDQGSLNYGINILDNLADIGRTYRTIGDHVKALRYLNEAMGIAERTRSADRVAGICNSLGILYSDQRDYAKALEFFQRGLRLASAQQDRIKQASMLLNIGVAYQFQGNYEAALKNFNSSLEIAATVNDKETIILVGEGVGAVYRAQGKYKESLEVLAKSLLLANDIGDKARTAELLWRRAETEYEKGDYRESRTSAAEAIRLAEQLSLPNVSYLALTTLGRAQRAEQKDDLAIETFSRAITRIEELRTQVASAEQGKQIFFEDKVGAYLEMVDVLASRKTRHSNTDALAYAERAKGRVLLEVLRSGKIDFGIAMTEREHIEERKLNGEIRALNIQLSQAASKKTSDDALVKRLSEQLESSRLRYEAFRDSLYVSHPELRMRSGKPAALTLDEISKFLRDDETAFLEYAVTRERTYVFVLTRGQQPAVPNLRIFQLNISQKDLAKLAHDFRRMLADLNPIFSDKARELYDVLIQPVADQITDKKTLCIIPDGPLWDLPFQALQSNTDRYLLEDYILYYAPSLGVYSQIVQKEQFFDRRSTSLMAFGNPYLGNDVVTNLKAVYRGEPLAPLPEAETEVNALKNIWGVERSKVVIGAGATKKVFKEHARNYKIIHLATHGILDDSNPMYSRLVLARGQDYPVDDGLLEAREIMQFNLNADLVVLSACQTARGRIGAGEGMIGMSWAFLMAGVPTLVVSQWKVDSAATATLMINFHQRLAQESRKGKMTKANALRQAALELLKQPKYRHPFYWASFVMVGDGG